MFPSNPHSQGIGWAKDAVLSLEPPDPITIPQQNDYLQSDVPGGLIEKL